MDCIFIYIIMFFKLIRLSLLGTNKNADDLSDSTPQLTGKRKKLDPTEDLKNCFKRSCNNFSSLENNSDNTLKKIATTSCHSKNNYDSVKTPNCHGIKTEESSSFNPSDLPLKLSLKSRDSLSNCASNTDFLKENKLCAKKNSNMYNTSEAIPSVKCTNCTLERCTCKVIVKHTDSASNPIVRDTLIKSYEAKICLLVKKLERLFFVSDRYYLNFPQMKNITFFKNFYLLSFTNISDKDKEKFKKIKKMCSDKLIPVKYAELTIISMFQNILGLRNTDSCEFQIIITCLRHMLVVFNEISNSFDEINIKLRGLIFFDDRISYLNYKIAKLMTNLPLENMITEISNLLRVIAILDHTKASLLKNLKILKEKFLIGRKNLVNIEAFLWDLKSLFLSYDILNILLINKNLFGIV